MTNIWIRPNGKYDKNNDAVKLIMKLSFEWRKGYLVYQISEFGQPGRPWKRIVEYGPRKRSNKSLTGYSTTPYRAEIELLIIVQTDLG